MTHTITLDAKTEAAIENKARKLGVSPEEFLLRIATEAAVGDEPSAKKPKSGAELIAALREDGILTGYGDPAIDSITLARQLRDDAQWRKHDK